MLMNLEEHLVRKPFGGRSDLIYDIDCRQFAIFPDRGAMHDFRTTSVQIFCPCEYILHFRWR